MMDNQPNLDKQELQKKQPNELKILFYFLAVFLVWQTISALLIPKAASEASDLTLENVLFAVSQERTRQNLSALNTDSRLSFAGQYKANDMMNRHYFSHTDPEGNYIWNKIVQAGYTPYLQLGENLAIEFYNTESLVSAWMNSPTHRANILNENFQDQGAGIAFGLPEQGQYYSAIANTFGALVPARKSPAPALPPIAPPSVSVKASPAQSKNIPAPKKIEVASPTTSGETTGSKVPPKGRPAESLRNAPLAQNFTLPQPKSAATGEPVFGEAPAVKLVLPPPPATQGLTAYEINRYLMLGFAAVLILMTVSDLKKIFAEKFRNYDKKINNLVLLALSLLVIGLTYWL